jgi:hypothetical protein
MAVIEPQEEGFVAELEPPPGGAPDAGDGDFECGENARDPPPDSEDRCPAWLGDTGKHRKPFTAAVSKRGGRSHKADACPPVRGNPQESENGSDTGTDKQNVCQVSQLLVGNENCRESDDPRNRCEPFRDPVAAIIDSENRRRRETLGAASKIRCGLREIRPPLSGAKMAGRRSGRGPLRFPIPPPSPLFANGRSLYMFQVGLLSWCALSAEPELLPDGKLRGETLILW